MTLICLKSLKTLLSHIKFKWHCRDCYWEVWKQSKAIKQNISAIQDFYFSDTEVRDILKETTALSNKKNGAFGNIPAKLLKKVSDICASALNIIWNKEIITQKSFPNNLRLGDETPVFKKEDASLLNNYRPVSVLPVVPKIYERIMQKQILEYIDKYLSSHLCGYRKGYSAQTALISIRQKWKLYIIKVLQVEC